LLQHENGLEIDAELSKRYTKIEEHDPSDLNRAREVASGTDPIPVGILYRNDSVPCYEETRSDTRLRTASLVRNGLEAEFDKFTICPEGHERQHA